MLTNSKHFRGQSITLGPEETSIVGQGKKFVAAGATRSHTCRLAAPTSLIRSFPCTRFSIPQFFRWFSPAPVLAQAKPTASATAPIPLTATLPVDSKIKIGTLPNGIRYYIRKNLKPEKRAELRLVVNAGSTLETDDQLGFAHFVEHTAFNGTTHFAKNDLVKYLQSIGVRFGADLNAYTGFDETVYILPIPTDTARLVDQAFTILEDWARGQVFDSAEVVNERGVVHEEWRLGKGAGDRMLHQWLPVALKGSLYADRLPIGSGTKHHVGDRRRKLAGVL